jgi:surface antigen
MEHQKGEGTMRRMVRGLAAAAMVVAMAMVAAPPLSAQLVSPFGRDSVGISPEDWTLMMHAMGAVLAQYKVGAKSDWKSPTTGRAGDWVLTRIFERDGMKCAQITHHFTAGPGYDYTAPVCKVPDGTWKLAF